MEASNLVIKVKYGETLRRINARIIDGDMDFSMDGLRAKIISLFNFSPNTELMLSYIDEDGDVVALVDDEDIHDVVKQALNPVRIHVKLDSGKNGHTFSRSSESPTPRRSPRVQQPSQNMDSDLLETLRSLRDPASKAFPCDANIAEQQPFHNLNSGLSQIVGTVKEPLQEAVLKLSTDLASKASTYPGVAELLDILAKLALSNLDQLSDSQAKVKLSTQSVVPESSVATETEGFGKSKVDSATLKVYTNGSSDEQIFKSSVTVSTPQPEATTEKNEVKYGNLKKTIIVGKKEKVKKDKLKKIMSECYANEKSRIKSSHQHLSASNGLFVGKFSEFCKTVDPQCAVNNVLPGQEYDKPYEPLSGPKVAGSSATDAVKGVSPDGRAKFLLSHALGNSLGNSPVSPWALGAGGFKFSGSLSGTSSIYECPFSGVAVGNTPVAPSGAALQTISFKKSSNQNDGSGVIIHRGVRCDGCGYHPITGPRFKSKVKVDYDLCSICFSRMGNETDYIRMDHPALYRPPVPFMGPHGSYTPLPSLQQPSRGYKGKSGASKLDSRFIQDINIVDGTILAPLTPFTKIWRMRNNGTVVWPQKTLLLWIGGDKLSRAVSLDIEIPAAGIAVDGEVDVAVDFVAPELPGRYISYWRMATPSGQKFGQRVWVLIQVDASIKKMPREIVRGFNLNLPPVTGGTSTPEIINVDPEPMVKDTHPMPASSKKTVESVKPAIGSQPNFEHELKFPINDSLLVGTAASGASSTASSALPSVLYPIVDMTPVAPTFTPIAQEETMGAEEILLRELKEMGFEQGDLNKEVLRRNEYNLEQTVDVLCGIAEWDPILEELQEMK